MDDNHLEHLISIVIQLKQTIDNDHQGVLPCLKDDLERDLEDNLRDLEMMYGITEVDLIMM